MFWLVAALVVLAVPPLVLAAVLVKRSRWKLLAALGGLLALAFALAAIFASLAGDNPAETGTPASLGWRLTVSAALFLFAANIPVVLGLISILGGRSATPSPARPAPGPD
jgi:hypothetical protein